MNRYSFTKVPLEILTPLFPLTPVSWELASCHFLVHQHHCSLMWSHLPSLATGNFWATHLTIQRKDVTFAWGGNKWRRVSSIPHPRVEQVLLPPQVSTQPVGKDRATQWHVSAILIRLATTDINYQIQPSPTPTPLFLDTKEVSVITRTMHIIHTMEKKWRD